MLNADPVGQKIEALRELLADLKEVVVCFSGGVDSSFLLAQAVSVLGERALALTAVSPSLTSEEGADAQQLAALLGARHVLVESHEADEARYGENPTNRCYFCKTEVYAQAVERSLELGVAHVLDGFNADDRADLHSGRSAAGELGVRSPLDELGFSKSDVREAAQRSDLTVWNKPALTGLSSRFTHEIRVTSDRLSQVAACERVLRHMGFRRSRVRHHDAMACIEVDPDEIPRFLDPGVRQQVAEAFRAAGFRYVALDLEGYRSGSLNEVVPQSTTLPKFAVVRD